MGKTIATSCIFFLTYRAVILRGHCSCKSGNDAACSHIFSLLWTILKSIQAGCTSVQIPKLSCTEQPRSWGTCKKVPAKITARFVDLIFRKSLPNKVSRNLELIKKRREKRKNTKATLTPEILESLFNELSDYKINSCFSSIISDNKFQPIPEPSTTIIEPEHLPDTLPRPFVLPVAILWEKEYNDILGQNISKLEHLLVSLEQCRNIEISTMDQSDSFLWLEIRGTILTASRFAAVVKRLKEITEQFLRTLKSSNFRGNIYTKLGLENEEFACAKYLSLPQNQKCSLFKTGLCINPGIPCLGASCDRIVQREDGEIGILEIKTLSKAKIHNYTMQEAIDYKCAPWIDVTTNNSFFVKPNCNHMYQVHGQMAITGLPWCDILVDCGVEFFVQRVFFDKNLWVNVMLPKLLGFCAKHLPLK